MAHIKSRQFRDEFFKLIRNDDVHIRLLSLHLWLISDRLKTIEAPSIIKSPRESIKVRKSKLVLSTRRFPSNFLYFGYQHFYNHLPEDLFFEDFASEFKNSCRLTFKHFDKYSKEPSDELLNKLCLKVTCNDIFDEEDPVISKLALYTKAHRNYLKSLPFEVLRDNKVNWGLKKVLKIEGSTEYEY